MEFVGEILSTDTGFLGNLNLRETSSNLKTLPGRVRHAAISIYGRVYECDNSCRINITRDPEFYKKMNDAEVCCRFITKVPEDLFEDWIEARFAQSNKRSYHLVRNNCIHFVLDACEFLGTDLPKCFQDTLDYLEHNEGIVMTAFKTMDSGRSATGNSQTSLQQTNDHANWVLGGLAFILAVCLAVVGIRIR